MSKHTQETTEQALNLVFDFGALVFLNESCDINLLDGSLDDKDFQSPRFYKHMLHAGLLHRMPDVDDKKIADITRGIPVTLVIKAIQSAIKGATGSDDEVNEQPTMESSPSSKKDAGESKPDSRT